MIFSGAFVRNSAVHAIHISEWTKTIRRKSVYLCSCFSGERSWHSLLLSLVHDLLWFCGLIHPYPHHDSNQFPWQRVQKGKWKLRTGGKSLKNPTPNSQEERHHQITTTSAVHDVPQNAIKLQVRSQCVFSRLQVLWTSVGWEIPEASTDEFSGWLRGPCQQCSSRINLKLMVDHHFPAMQWGKGSFRQFWVSLYLYAICKFPTSGIAPLCSFAPFPHLADCGRCYAAIRCHLTSSSWDRTQVEHSMVVDVVSHTSRTNANCDHLSFWSG